MVGGKRNCRSDQEQGACRDLDKPVSQAVGASRVTRRFSLRNPAADKDELLFSH